MIEKIRSAGMNSPPTVRQTVIGVASSRPTGPHNHPQKIAETSSAIGERSEEHTSELQSHSDLVCLLLLEKKTEIEYVVCVRIVRELLCVVNGLKFVQLW